MSVHACRGGGWTLEGKGGGGYYLDGQRVSEA